MVSVGTARSGWVPTIEFNSEEKCNAQFKFIQHYFEGFDKLSNNYEKEEYAKSISHTVNHFYEKLFLLKDLIKTESGKEIAKRRHELMQQFINDFYDEWFFSASKK
jgi:HD superfamily phosphodiesterase